MRVSHVAQFASVLPSALSPTLTATSVHTTQQSRHHEGRRVFHVNQLYRCVLRRFGLGRSGEELREHGLHVAAVLRQQLDGVRARKRHELHQRQHRHLVERRWGTTSTSSSSSSYASVA